jgi:rfaE bifunctional protein kinase chain/domain
MELTHLLPKLETFKSCSLMVIGDLILDEYLLTSTGRVSREAPVLVTDFEASHHVLGGAGNVIMNLHRLGARVIPVGFLGDDGTADLICRTLETNGISTAGLLRIPGGITPKKSRILAGAAHTRKQQILRIDYTTPLGLTPAHHHELQNRMQRLGEKAQVIILSDYLHQSARGDLVAKLSSLFSGIPLITDSRRHFRSFTASTYITPNEEEFCSLFEERPRSEAEFWASADRLMSDLELQGIILKRGHLGMMLCDKTGRRITLPAHGTNQIVDVTGAGDTVIAVAALGLSSGLDLFDAARLSNVAASLVVMHEGTYALSNEELRHEIENRD